MPSGQPDVQRRYISGCAFFVSRLFIFLLERVAELNICSDIWSVHLLGQDFLISLETDDSK